MASSMVLSSVAVGGVTAAASAYGVGGGRKMSTSCMQLGHTVCKISAYNCGFLSGERRLQSQFSSQTLHGRGEPKHCSFVFSSRSELAADADRGNVIDVESSEAMKKYLNERGKMVVVDISTTTCGPCKLIFPKVVKMSTEYPNVLFLRINGDQSNDTRTLMREWGVTAVPNFRFFIDGVLVHSHTGAKEDELRAHFLTHYMTIFNVPA